MAFRSREMMKKIVKKIGGENNLTSGAKEQLMKSLPNTKVVMGRAQRGLFAGRHIQFGNRVSEDGGNKTKRSWKPNVQEKRLFSYILDRHIRVKVTTHALRCIDKAGGIDEYLLKTPYHKMDTEMGLYWKTKIKKMYEDLGDMEVVFFSPEDETNFEEQFKQLKLDEREVRRDARRKILLKDSGSQVDRAPVTYIIASHLLEKGKMVMNYDWPKAAATSELARPAQNANTT